MDRKTRSSSQCIDNRISNMLKGKQKCNIEKNISKTLSLQNNKITSSVKKQCKLDTTKILTNRLDPITTQSIQETYGSLMNVTYSCQKLNAEEKRVVTLAQYLFREQDIPICVQEENKIISDIEQFKTDETPVAVPICEPSTPHRINMPLDDSNITTTITKEKQPVTLRSPLQVIKKSAPHGRKKVASNHTFKKCLSKPASTGSTNHSITDYFPVRRSVRKSKKTVLEEKQRDLEKKVLCQMEEGLEVRHFPGKGRGVIATREFAKGEFVVEYTGELINQMEAKEREKIYAQDQNAGCYMYYFQHRNQQYCVDATAETVKLGRLVNHSRNGNLVTRIVEVGSIPHLILTAKEDIPIDIEVTYDYGDRSRESIRHHPWLAL